MTTRPEPGYPTVDPEPAMASDIAAAVEAYLTENPPGDVTEIIAAPIGFDLAASAGLGVVDGDVASWAVPDTLPLPGGTPFLTWETAETAVGTVWTGIQKWTMPETINGVNTPTLVHTVGMGDLTKGVRVMWDLSTSTGPHDRIVMSFDDTTAVAAEPVPNSRDPEPNYTVWTPAFAGPTKAIDFQESPVAEWTRPLPAVLPAAGVDVEVTAWIGHVAGDSPHEVLTHPYHDPDTSDFRIRVAVAGANGGNIAVVPNGAPSLFCEVHPQGYVGPEGQPEAPTKLHANMRWTPGVRATFRVTYDPIAGRMQAWALAPWEADAQTPDGRWWTLCRTVEGDDLVVASPTDGGIEWDLLGGFNTGRSCGGVDGTKVEQVVVRDLAWGAPIAWLDVAGLTVGDETYTDPTDDVAWDTTAEGGALVAWVPFAPGV